MTKIHGLTRLFLRESIVQRWIFKESFSYSIDTLSNSIVQRHKGWPEKPNRRRQRNLKGAGDTPNQKKKKKKKKNQKISNPQDKRTTCDANGVDK